MLTERQFPWTSPYGLAEGPLKSKGPTAEALKRFFGRIGKLEWRDYDQHYNKELWDLVADLKVNQGILKKSDPRDGSYGKAVWEHIRTRKVPPGKPNSGEYAIDFYSRKIVKDEAGELSGSNDIQKVQFFINEFWRIAIANRGIWHYSQNRPFDSTVDPSRGGYSDCSAMIVQAHRYAQEKSGIEVPDPARWKYGGYGNTDWYEDDWPKIGAPFRVGDLAHFHSSRHVIECIKPGNFDTAHWGSNGSEAAPELLTSLRSYYRFPDEYMFTVRPPLTKEETNA